MMGGSVLRVLTLVAAAILLVPLTVFAAPEPVPEGCAPGPVESALSSLHPAAKLAHLDELGAVALLPIVHPGVTIRLVERDGHWCDAHLASDRLATGSPLDRAKAYARVAAAPFFDGVTITRAVEPTPGLVQLTTHARTNGIVADWRFLVDAQGIREATWVATAIAIAPFEVDLEGFTALPGATRTYARDNAGLLQIDRPLVPTQAALPTIARVATDKMSDGFSITYHYGPLGLPHYPTVGDVGPTGELRRAVTENYEEFLTWGFTKGWKRNIGDVYLDDEVSLTCIACVFISENFNIHMSSAAVDYLDAFGYRYPDRYGAVTTIVGHEMFHNWQNRYYKPDAGSFIGGAFIEGLARFSETLHTYSSVSHQPNSLVYADDANGCNYELGSQARAPNLSAGPSTGQSYSACDFWLTLYGHHGAPIVQKLLMAAFDHREKTGWNEFRSIVEQATGNAIEDDLARFAAAILTGENLSWGPHTGAGPSHDWSEHLLGWPVTTLAPGNAFVANLTDGGMMGARVEVSGVVNVNTTAVKLYRVDPTGAIATLSNGATVSAPAWIVAIQPGVGSERVQMSYANAP